MNHVLLWKEYRQQRAIWLVIALLGILLVLILGLAMGQGTGLEVFRDGSIRPTLITIILALGVTYGIVCGALLLAGEKEDRTLDFLDGLAGQRGPVWRRKATAGALFTLAQGLVMALLIAILGLGSWQTALIVLYWCLDGLAWGLLGGSLCQKVLVAVLAGIAFMASSWLLALFVNTSLVLYLGKAMLAGAAVLSSRRIFCQDDPSRQTTSRRSRFTIPLPAGWRSLLWLCFRQGRWVLAGGLVFAIALGLTVNLAPLVIWPIGSLLLGLACGLAAFCPDQGDGNRFLGAQRFSPGRIWMVKALFWGIATIVFTVLAWQLGLVSINLDSTASHDREQWFRHWIGSGNRIDLIVQVLSPALFLGLWPLYVFGFGQFFGQAASRPIIGAILAIVTASIAAGLWIPSLVFGGVPLWQFLAIPAILLATARLSMWPWISGRLSALTPFLGILAGMALIVFAKAGFLWYRAVEVPDVGEPFDVNVFVASLPAPEENQAGVLIRKAATDLVDHQAKVEKRLRLTELDFPKDKRNAIATDIRILWDVGRNGWPKEDKEIGRWLDQIFDGKWVNEAKQAARLPLGIVQDPRNTTLSTRTQALYGACGQMSYLFPSRALQLQTHGDSRQALQHLETTLGLSRQLRNKSSNWYFQQGISMEISALAAYDIWIQNIGADKKLLGTALAILQKHEAALPDPAGSIKAQFLIYRNSEPASWNRVLISEIEKAAYQVPWEKERQHRIGNAIFLCQLGQLERPPWQIPTLKELRDQTTNDSSFVARTMGFPPEAGPGSELNAETWGSFLFQSWAFANLGFFGQAELRRRPELPAAQLITALTLYQADKGKPPAKLDDLVPKYLPKLPIDPTNGKSFGYRISKGEEINGFFPSGTEANRRLEPGQALVWSEGSLYKFPVPVWKK